MTSVEIINNPQNNIIYVIISLTVCKDPPYRLQESGYGSFNLPIDVFFKTNAKEDARKHQMNYDLSLQMIGLPPLNCTKIEALTFLNPSEEFERRLLKAGAVILPSE